MGGKKVDKNEFIKRAVSVHGDKYDYRETEFLRLKDVAKIGCKTHGIFLQNLGNHIKGAGCPKCSIINRNKKRLDSFDNIIKKFKLVHGDRYDYSEVIYKRSNAKVKIICKEHGPFEQRPNDHVNGQGCPECGGSLRITNNEFIKRSGLIHGKKYDYSQTKYINSKTPVKIICKKHGLFEQVPNNHLNGAGCGKCAGNIKISKKIFIERAINIHGNKYDYSNVKIKGINSTIKIVCKEHGEFEQVAKTHLKGNGCQKCVHEIKYNTETFIEKSRAIHGDKYDYSRSVYTFSKDRTKIICREHGEFEQIARIHMAGANCPRCLIDSSIERKVTSWLESTNIIYERGKIDIINPKEIDIYLPDYKIGIECNGLYWHSEEYKKDKRYHISKTIDCEKRGIRLLHFWDFEINEKFDIVKSIILNAIGKTENKLYARNMTLDKFVCNSDAKKFCNNHHLHGFRGGRHKIGLRDKNGEVVSLMIAGSDGEMVRFVSKINTNVVGGFSRLLKHTPVKYSFVDRRLYNGHGYLKNGFKIEHHTTPNYFYVKNGKYAGSRQQFQKHKLYDKLDIFNNSLSEVENMKKNGYYRVFDCGNYKVTKEI